MQRIEPSCCDAPVFWLTLGVSGRGRATPAWPARLATSARSRSAARRGWAPYYDTGRGILRLTFHTRNITARVRMAGAPRTIGIASASASPHRMSAYTFPADRRFTGDD